MVTLAVDQTGEARPMRAGEIPIIDFAPFRSGGAEERKRVAAAIGDACESVGFMYLAGHGIPQSMIDDVFKASADFFAQSDEVKRRSAATWDWYRGFVPPKKVGEDGRKGGLNQVYRLMLDLPADDPDVLARKPLHLPNRWPENLPGWKEAVGGYYDRLVGFSHELLEAFAIALDLPPDWFKDKFKRPLAQLSLLYYPPLPADAPMDLMSAYPHTDEGAFTILTQDTVGGLEVRPKSGQWIQAPLVPGAYVINIGDMMMKWTNGRFVSTPHRVRNRSGRERYSIPFFMNPDYDVEVACLDTCTSPEYPPRFAPIQNGEHMRVFWEKGMAYLKPDAG